MDRLIPLLFFVAGSLAAIRMASRRSRREELAKRLLRIKEHRVPEGKGLPPVEAGGDDWPGNKALTKKLPVWLARSASSLPLCPESLELEKAGLDLKPGEFQSIRLLLLVSLAITVLLLGGLVPLLVCLFPAALFSWYLPALALKRRQAQRQESISDALPEVLDLLTLLLHAGQGLNMALPRAMACSRGPLREEFERFFALLELGMPRHRAFSLLEEANTSEDLRRFIRVMQRAERFGAPLSSSMEGLAAEMRHRQKSRLQERAHKAPVKILFPLVFLILPSFLLLTVGGMVLGGHFF